MAWSLSRLLCFAGLHCYKFVIRYGHGGVVHREAYTCERCGKVKIKCRYPDEVNAEINRNLVHNND